ncbi:MAG: hypothetical protein LBI80_03415 [Endomicrobium sp.]|nr:hypothetical protein [Endomicrobium sp.]
MKNNTVVITSTTCVTSLAEDPMNLWEELSKGNIGIDKLKKFDNNSYSCGFGGIASDFNFRNINVIGKNIMNRTNQLEFYSVMKAFQNTNFSENSLESCNLYLGNHIINIDTETMEIMIKLCYENDNINFSKLGTNLKSMSPLNGVKLLPTTPSHFIAKENNIHGKGDVVYSSEISGLLSLMLAFNEICSGNVDMAVVASSYNPFTPHEFLWLCDQGLIKKTSPDDDSKKLVFPFDRKHNGMIYSEGSAALILESEESAKKNGRKILAYIDGASSNIFAGETFYSLSKKGFSENINSTLENSNIKKENIDVIFSNAPSYPSWDDAELEVILDIWNENQVIISNSKSYLGFTGPVSGIIDCILSIISMNKNKYLPINNFEEASAKFEGKEKQYINCISKKDLKRSLITSAGIGGAYSSVCLRGGNVK